MSDKPTPASSARQLLFSALLLGAAEFAAAVFVLASIERDPTNVAFLGLSPQRLTLLAFAALAALACLGAAVTVLRQPTLAVSSIEILSSRATFRRAAFWLLGSLALLGWLALALPPYIFLEQKDFFIRLRPIPIAAGALAFQLLLWGLLVLTPQKNARLKAFYTNNRPVVRLSAWILAALLALWAIVSVTGAGLVPDDRFWNVPGMPITGFQFFASLLLVTVLIFTQPLRLSRRQIDFLACLILFLAAGLLWNATTLKQHHFSPQPTGPDHQPYPASDAIVYDASAHYFINGYGIFSSGYSDKPLYGVFLGLLHLLAGEDYWLLTLLQVWVLALIPPMIYLIGRSINSPPLGFFLAVLILLRQRNAIAGSHLIASANVKLLVSEVPMLLGLLFCAWILFKWWKSSPRSGILAAVAGGIIGIISLIRLNAILLLPAAALYALFLYRGQIRLWWKHIARLALAFMLVFTPVVLTGTGPDGVPLLVFKFMEVIRTRYLPGTSFQLPASQTASAGTSTIQIPLFAADTPAYQFVPAHFAHNLVGALLTLPDSLVYDNLQTMAERPYWVEGNQWAGQLPPGQIAALAVNLALVALGLARAWKDYRWAGLVPLLIFLVYNTALSLGRTSGSRYLVPIDWVVYLYFATGIVELLALLKAVFVPHPTASQPAQAVIPVISRAGRQASWLVFLPFALVGVGMHIVDDYMPKRFAESAAIDSAALVQSYLPDNNTSATSYSIYAGQGLYPRFAGEKTDQPHLDFYVLSPEHGVINARLIQHNDLQSFPSGSYIVVAGCPVVVAGERPKINLDTHLIVVISPDSNTVLYSQPKPDVWGCR
ncbi:MAG: hypothetical protein JW987_12405 [Anaerolineaceae bacterium]|nr:hypothetical protein [Anaerolineaceae bacterium]